MTKGEAINWIINISADIGKAEHSDLWHYEQALSEIREMLEDAPTAQPEIIRCKDCKHFEYDHPYIIRGIPVLGHEVCNAWGNGCKTDQNGFCFMGERREDGVDS